RRMSANLPSTMSKARSVSGTVIRLWSGKIFTWVIVHSPSSATSAHRMIRVFLALGFTKALRALRAPSGMNLAGGNADLQRRVRGTSRWSHREGPVVRPAVARAARDTTRPDRSPKRWRASRGALSLCADLDLSPHPRAELVAPAHPEGLNPGNQDLNLVRLS